MSEVKPETIKNYNSILSNFKSINTVSFSKDIQTLYSAFEDEEGCEGKLRLSFGNLLYNKLYTYYKVPRIKISKHSQLLEKNIKAEHNPILKGLYLQYRDIDMLVALCEKLYRNSVSDGVVDEKQTFFLVQLLNDETLLKYPNSVDSEELLIHFLTWIRNERDTLHRYNLLDTFLRHFRRDPRVEAIHEEMKWEENRRNQFAGNEDVRMAGPRNVYTDSQNVHDHDIATSISGVVRKLVEWYRQQSKNMFGSDFTPLVNEIRKALDNWDISAEGVLERLHIDTARNDGVVLAEVLHAVILYISTEDNIEIKSELIKRLREELRESNGMCYTGHISRFVNVLQGYSKNFQIKISIAKEIQAIISHIISLKMQNNELDEKIISGSYDAEYKDYYNNFILELLNKKLESGDFKEYRTPDLITSLPIVGKFFTNLEYEFDIPNNKLIKKRK